MTAHTLTRQVRTGGQTDGSRTYIANRGSSHIECITAIHPNSDAARETPYRNRNKQEAVKLKQMGVKAGVSDLCLPYPKGLYCGLYIEMKFGDNRQQETQKEFLADMAAAGHFVATCYSAEEAVKVIEEYCKLMNHKMGDCEIVIPLENREELRNITMSIPNNSILKNGEIKESKPRKK